MGTGKFRCALEPGGYKLTVTAKGFPEFKHDFNVPVATQPIWQERAHLKTPEKDMDTVLLPILLSK